MGREEDGSTLIALLPHDILQKMGCNGVQAYKRLVHDDKLRIMYQG